MLPDFPKQKEMLNRFLEAYLDDRSCEYLGILSEAPRYRHYEGEKWSLRLENDIEDDSGYRELAGHLPVEMSEVPELSLYKVVEKIDEVAQDMARQQAQGMFAEID